jgi:hypothetical protein
MVKEVIFKPECNLKVRGKGGGDGVSLRRVRETGHQQQEGGNPGGQDRLDGLNIVRIVLGFFLESS